MPSLMVPKLMRSDMMFWCDVWMILLGTPIPAGRGSAALAWLENGCPPDWAEWPFDGTVGLGGFSRVQPDWIRMRDKRLHPPGRNSRNFRRTKGSQAGNV